MRYPFGQLCSLAIDNTHFTPARYERLIPGFALNLRCAPLTYGERTRHLFGNVATFVQEYFSQGSPYPKGRLKQKPSYSHTWAF